MTTPTSAQHPQPTPTPVTTTSRATAAPTRSAVTVGEDDITGGGSAANGVLDANRDGTFDATRSGETLSDAGDTINGDSGDGAVGLGDVVAGDNARIQRKLDVSGDWRNDAQRGTKLRDVFLFDVRIVGNAEPGNADPGESGPDTIAGNGGNDILLGQDNGQADTADGDAYGRESGATARRTARTPHSAPARATITGGIEFPSRRRRQRQAARHERPGSAA